MQLAFILTMPSANSWNGKWSGEGRLYCIIRKVSDSRAAELLEKRHFWYSWSDGWGGNIEVRQVDAAEARKLRKESVGFAGYEWMVETIVLYGKAMADHEVSDHLAKQKEPALS